ncbi:MAG: isoleucine--tRNA ligase [Proteobacteria bacterium]|nr:isoleucine--tRNA ligase [Pseudomonadota bacterium]MBU1714275.1 isoleucine--tRNA ligase [Pseudomonadota bacterium]
MDYRATLNLPQTAFKMKANLAQKEPELIKKWDKEDLYGKVQAATADRPSYVLHDGPPYANGHIHMGHALNKILKDIILRSKRMSGFHCSYVPGWDCHGLPIEHNVDKELGAKKREISKLAFRNACRKYAGKWIKAQKDEFKRLGILGDWDNPYLTINYSYEAATAREFNRFLSSGAVVRSKKPVYWCTSCGTALAEAEVEYADHGSLSVYVKFPLPDDLGEVNPVLAGIKNLSVVIWTTTPWTLPANLAVALHPDFTYAAVRVKNETLIMAEGLVEKACAAFGIAEYEIIATFGSAGLEGRKCRHPFMDRDSLIVLADYVTLETGTGCVHTAPGHGREDYITGLRYNLEVLSPVDGEGVFTDEAGPYKGMMIKEANPVICDDLGKNGFLLARKEMSHSYPHCWRCKKPVIFRATEQWFISMENNDLRGKALAAIKEVAWTPVWGMERIYGMVEGRPDWCLSRQRAWGVPITAIMCGDCGEIQNNEQINGKINELFLKEGADAWFSHEVGDFMPEGAACAKCGSGRFEKEEDILDVWFDSGTSYAAVLEERADLSAPADLYLEGSDQHRGWFQSSLLASVGTRGVPPYKGVLTHGFVVDKNGRKMSKSVGNVIAPEEIIKQYGAEILRLWVASEDYRDDIKISDNILKQLSDAYRKIRNTIRYLLGNISDFNPATDRVAYDQMPEIDQWALSQLEQLKERLVSAYDLFEFHQMYHRLLNFCTVTMSSFYLDIIKDRLYTAAPDSVDRRSAQTVLYDLTDGILRLMAPVLTFTATEIWEHLPADPSRESDLALASFPTLNSSYLRKDLDQDWERLIKVRGEFTKALEIARQEKVIGHPLEAQLLIAVTGELGDFMQKRWNSLKTIAIVSGLELVAELKGDFFQSEELPGLSIQVRPAAGEKCERCWIRSESVGLEPAHPEICGRCVSVVNSL